MKIQSNSGFSLVEMMVGIAVAGLIALGARQMMLRAQESNQREGLRKNYAEVSQELMRRLNHHYQRLTSKTLAPHKLSMALPSGAVVIETVCVKNELAYQAPDVLLNRCVKCGSGQRQVIRIQNNEVAQYFPSSKQRPDVPAAASICFKNGSDPSEVEMIVEILVVDPINKSEKKVSKLESILVQDPSKVSLFE